MTSIVHKIIYPCARVGEMAYDFLENKLPPTVQTRLKLHLAICKPCMEYIRLYREAADGARFRDEAPPPPEMVEHIMDFLQREAAQSGNGNDSGGNTSTQDPS